MAIYGKGKSKNNSIIEPGRERAPRSGVGHDGRSRAFAKPGEATVAVHHSSNAPRVHEGVEAQQHSSSARRSTTGKQFHDVAPHKSMTDQQVKMAGVGGMGHATSIDGVPGANPLDPNPLPKRTSDLAVKPGMRNRVTRIKSSILKAATCFGDNVSSSIAADIVIPLVGMPPVRS